MYFGKPCYGYALNCLLSIWSYNGHSCYLSESKSYLLYLHATSKNGIHICSNKHETGLVLNVNAFMFDLSKHLLNKDFSIEFQRSSSNVSSQHVL